MSTAVADTTITTTRDPSRPAKKQTLSLRLPSCARWRVPAPCATRSALPYARGTAQQPCALMRPPLRASSGAAAPDAQGLARSAAGPEITSSSGAAAPGARVASLAEQEAPKMQDMTHGDAALETKRWRVCCWSSSQTGTSSSATRVQASTPKQSWLMIVLVVKCI